MATLLLKTTTLTSVDLSVTRGCFKGRCFWMFLGGGKKLMKLMKGGTFQVGNNITR